MFDGLQEKLESSEAERKACEQKYGDLLTSSSATANQLQKDFLALVEVKEAQNARIGTLESSVKRAQEELESVRNENNVLAAENERLKAENTAVRAKLTKVSSSASTMLKSFLEVVNEPLTGVQPVASGVAPQLPVVAPQSSPAPASNGELIANSVRSSIILEEKKAFILEKLSVMITDYTQ
jgi:TolA-binding protein